MMHVITGGSGSGKSAYAEEQVLHLADGECAKYYIATMEPFGEETIQKIERHRNMRAGKGFDTLECYVNLRDTVREHEELQNSVVLLECMSNLTANELYRPDGAGKDSKEVILEGINALRDVCRHLVVVTNEVSGECTTDTKEMTYYKQTLAEINRKMAYTADRVTEVVYGIPVTVKGEKAI